jgi:superfamily I DNA/RNA helicase
MELVNLEVQMGTPLKRIAYLSFTKSAREVIKERLNASEADVKWFRTIHGACCMVMGIAGNIINWQDYRKFSALTGMKITPEELDDYDDHTPTFNITLRALNLAANQMVPVSQVVKHLNQHPMLTQQRVAHFDAEWRKFKRAEHKFDYMDMLTQYDGTPIDIDVGFLDEAQDLTELQWQIVRSLFAKCQRFYMAGDDDQAIYTFIGASEYGFLEHPCDEEEVLQQSYRVPRAIGNAADKIIRKVKHRKEKNVRWKRDPGTFDTINLDALTIPWRVWLPRYESIMVLTRHRRVAKSFSDDLATIGVPHALNGESMQAWKEARHLQTYISLKEGLQVLPSAAGALLKEIGKDASRFRDMSRRDRVSRAGVPEIDFEDAWVVVLSAGDTVKRKRYEALRRLIQSEGSQILAAEPKVMVGTMHASKGREADLIIIVPDCTPIVRQNLNEATEIRLAFVSITRAKKQAVVLVPRTELYIPHFFGG